MSERWEPRVLRAGETEAAVEGKFRFHVEQFGLQYRCPDCVYVRTDGTCSVGWPNARLMGETILWQQGIPNFCKAFEAE